jgi:hypothetical protein
VTNAVNDCRDFLRFSTKGFIVLAAFEVVSVNSSENFTSVFLEASTIYSKTLRTTWKATWYTVSSLTIMFFIG